MVAKVFEDISTAARRHGGNARRAMDYGLFQKRLMDRAKGAPDYSPDEWLGIRDFVSDDFQRIGNFTLYVVVVFAVVSAIDYFRRFWTKIDDRFKAKERRRLILLQKRQRRHVSTRDVPTH